MAERSSEPHPIDAPPAANGNASVASEIKSAPTDPDPGSIPPKGRKSRRTRTLLFGALGAVVLAAVIVFGIPAIRLAFNTVSTDDAYVNGHVTFVAARVPGQVSRVLVDDNNRVQRGDLLIELDKEPYRNAVAISRAAVDVAKANLLVAMATARGIEADVRSQRWKLQNAIEAVGNQEALLRARVAAFDKSKAALILAQVNFERASKLVASDTVSHSEYDQRQAELSTARAEVTQALAEVYQIRASLGLPPVPENGNLAQVPPDLNQTFSSVLQAQADLIQGTAQLGVIHSYGQTPTQMLEQFQKSEPHGNIDLAFARLAAKAPVVRQAEAKLEAAKRDLAQAELNLRYCDVVAAISGVVTRRNVNPGDNVQVGQSLMVIQSVRDIWVDANFKETQLRSLRIGQPVTLYTDTYGASHPFEGRIAGFTFGTGQTLALLPAQNATGNFVKVVQRLPVRIELENYDPDKTPLFYGLSVVPYVYIHRPPTGANAGRFLQTYVPRSPSALGLAARSPGAGQ